MTKKSSVVGLVLAAGASTRMGKDTNKLCVEVDGKSLVAGPVDALHGAGVEPIYLVVGSEAHAIEETLVGRAYTLIHHPGWQDGMGSSLAAGVQGILEREEPEGILVSVGDLAGLRPEWIGLLLKKFASLGDSKSLCVPTFEGRPGHPVLFGAAHFQALTQLSGDAGGKSILEANEAHVYHVAIENDAILRDLDTPADFEAWEKSR